MRRTRNSFQFSDLIPDFIHHCRTGAVTHRRWFIHPEWEKRHRFMEALELLSMLMSLKNGTWIKEVLLLIQQRMIYTLQPPALLKNGACTNTSCLFVLMSLAKRLIWRDALQIQKTPDQRFNEDRRNHLYQPSSSKRCRHHLGSTTGLPHASIPGVNTPIMSTLAACESALAEGNPVLLVQKRIFVSRCADAQLWHGFVGAHCPAAPAHHAGSRSRVLVWLKTG